MRKDNKPIDLFYLLSLSSPFINIILFPQVRSLAQVMCCIKGTSTHRENNNTYKFLLMKDFFTVYFYFKFYS